jgi:hypothetical protein
MNRTLDNCTLVKRHGRPYQKNGKCLGYANDTDEPCETCKKCKLNEAYKEEDKDMEEIQSLKDFAKALVAQNKIDMGELKR